MKLVRTITLFTLCTMLTISSLAQSLGDLDSDFGSSGFGITNYEIDSAEYLMDILSLKNDKILNGGYILQSGSFDLLVSRMNKNGSIDLNFGDKGYWSYDINGSSDKVHAMLELFDGKIILVGSTYKPSSTNGFIMRLNADGSLDKSFGAGSKGYTLFNAGKNSYCSPVDIELYKGSFYVAATTYSVDDGSDFGLFKISQSGIVVPSFSKNGSTLINIKGSETASSLDVGDDGTFIIGGTSYKNGIQYGAIVKLNQFGLKTTAFDGAGYFVYNEGSDLNTINDVSYDSKGRIVAIGSEGKNPDKNGMVFRFTSAGFPDNTFATKGKISSDIGSTNGVFLNTLFIDDNDHIICVGYLSGPSYKDVYVLKLTDEGRAHPKFGTKGDVNYKLPLNPSYIFFKSAAMQSDGSLIIGGTTTISGFDAFNITVSRIFHWKDQTASVLGDKYENQVTLYPNPAHNHFKVNAEGSVVQNATLLDLQGRQVYTWENVQTKQGFIIPSSLTAGTYLFKCTYDNAFHVGRIVIK
jgi:uncharacterized delta-60 repeat protein